MCVCVYEGGGGVHTSTENRDQKFIVGMRGHTSAEDTRILVGQGACNPGKF